MNASTQYCWVLMVVWVATSPVFEFDWLWVGLGIGSLTFFTVMLWKEDREAKKEAAWFKTTITAKEETPQ